jgi:hypothetical protein
MATGNMNNSKLALVDLAVTGGLYLWDSETRPQVDNPINALDQKQQLDWFMFFDMMREEPAFRTEEIIQAITAGLCPVKGYEEYGVGDGSDFAVKRRPFWYFGVGKVEKFTERSVPEITQEHLFRWTREPPSRYTTETTVLPQDQYHQMGVYGRWRWRDAKLIYLFRHPRDAWQFLFSFM